MGLEAIYRRPRTSDAQPGHRVYPYLLRGLTIDRPDQVWCADITYIPLSAGFLYLVAIMDWASRHVLAWRLSNTMDTGFCVEALEAALRMGTPDIFNTDQGAQFTSAAFTDRVPGGGCPVLDGRPRTMPGQRLHRAAVAVAEVRGCVSSRAVRRVRGRAGDRDVDDVLEVGFTVLHLAMYLIYQGLADRQSVLRGILAVQATSESLSWNIGSSRSRALNSQGPSWRGCVAATPPARLPGGGFSRRRPREPPRWSSSSIRRPVVAGGSRRGSCGRCVEKSPPRDSSGCLGRSRSRCG